MAEITGKAKAVLEWAKGWEELDGFLKLNALITQEGQATLNTVTNDSIVQKYIDGTAIRHYTVQLKVITSWSDGYDPVNVEAERLASSWLDWVNRQFPENVPEWEGADITGIEALQNAPALNRVFENDSLAEYVIQAQITYIE